MNERERERGGEGGDGGGGGDDVGDDDVDDDEDPFVRRKYAHHMLPWASLQSRALVLYKAVRWICSRNEEGSTGEYLDSPPLPLEVPVLGFHVCEWMKFFSFQFVL